MEEEEIRQIHTKKELIDVDVRGKRKGGKENNRDKEGIDNG